MGQATMGEPSRSVEWLRFKGSAIPLGTLTVLAPDDAPDIKIEHENADVTAQRRDGPGGQVYVRYGARARAIVIPKFSKYRNSANSNVGNPRCNGGPSRCLGGVSYCCVDLRVVGNCLGTVKCPLD